MDDRAFWVGFNLVKGIGAVRLNYLLDYFGDLRTAWQASAEELHAAGLHQKTVGLFLKTRAEVDPEQELERILKLGIQVIIREDAQYPRKLKEIQQPPPVLYVRGTLVPEDEWAVGIVGTRRVTAYGRQVTQQTASFLAQNGVTVVSGLARGVDGIAHQAALEAGGRSLAVLGCGVDMIYPPEHQKLAERLIEHGAILSDYPPGTPPESSNFPPRNRIISGLSLATVVIEAGFTSGALITATFAVEQGREVFAVPGNINAAQSQGTNRLIQQGAHPLLKPSEILDVLDLQQVYEYRAVQNLVPADEIEEKLLKIIGGQPLHVDEICNQAGLPVAKVSAALAMMELKGMVQQTGGMNYISLRENQENYGMVSDAEK